MHEKTFVCDRLVKRVFVSCGRMRVDRGTKNNNNTTDWKFNILKQFCFTYFVWVRSGERLQNDFILVRRLYNDDEKTAHIKTKHLCQNTYFIHFHIVPVRPSISSFNETVELVASHHLEPCVSARARFLQGKHFTIAVQRKINKCTSANFQNLYFPYGSSRSVRCANHVRSNPSIEFWCFTN